MYKFLGLILIMLLASVAFVGCNGPAKEYETIQISYFWNTVKSNMLKETLYENYLMIDHKVEKGQGFVIPHPSANPENYTFDDTSYRYTGWDKVGETVYKSTSVHANYSRLYDVTYKVYNGSFESSYIKGEIPEHLFENDGSDNVATYTFIKWDKELAPVEGDGEIYTAKYDVNIKEGVTEIPADHFKNAEYIRNITVPQSVTEIGSNAFNGCKAENFEMDFSALTKVGDSAFINCESITVNNLDNLVKVGAKAFDSCSAITTLNFKNIETIGVSAFNNCGNLTSVKIPQTITSIGAKAFNNCDILNNIQLDKISTIASFTSVFGKTAGCSVTLGDSITSIADKFFLGSELTSINIPKNVTKIGSLAFSNCYYLNKIQYDSVKIENNSSTNNIFNLAGTLVENGIKVTVGKNVPAIPSYLFYNSSKENYANITEVFFAEGSICTEIALLAFSNLAELVTINLPNGIKKIANFAFSGCEKMEISVDFPNIEVIGRSAFENCKKIDSIIIPKGITSIEESTFSSCSGVTSLSLPVGLKTIGASAFRELAVNSLTIPSTVTSIATAAFSYCKNIIEVVLPAGIEDLSYNAFPVCLSLTTISIIGNSNANYSSIDGVIYNAAVTEIIICPSGRVTSLTIPEGVTKINERAFQFCNIPEIIFPSTLLKIEKDGLYVCEEITKLIIPKSVTTIEDSAFSSCSKLEEVLFEKNSSLTSINNYLFTDCSNLRIVILPVSIKSLDGRSFYGTPKNVKILYCGTEAAFNKITITYPIYINNLAKLYYGTDWEYDADGITPKVTANQGN